MKFYSNPLLSLIQEMGKSGGGWGGGRMPAREPHQVHSHDDPQTHDPPDGLGRVHSQVGEPVAEHLILEPVLLGSKARTVSHGSSGGCSRAREARGWPGDTGGPEECG